MTPNLCPFCGSADVRVEENATFTWVECLSCDARGTQVIGEDGAIKAWNRRAKQGDTAPDGKHELPAFTQMLREMGVPFCWYRNSEALMDRYAARIDGEFYLRNIQLVGVEVGNSLFVFETKSDHFVLADLKHNEGSLPGSFADGVEGNVTMLMRTHSISRAGFEDEGEIAAHPDRGRTEQPCISRAELECHADTSHKIDEWLSGTSRTLAAMLEGYEYDPDSRVVYGSVHIMEPSEDYGRREWSVSFEFLREGEGQVLCHVDFPARYLWMENWRDQLKLDSEKARQERRALEVSLAQGRVASAERKVEGAKRELARIEKKEV